jgi:hypothetical protein
VNTTNRFDKKATFMDYYQQLNIGDALQAIESLPSDATIYLLGEYGEKTFPSYPHSYRGYYDQLAFTQETRTGTGVVGRTVPGWKGGDYTMERNTSIFIAEVGSLGGQFGVIFEVDDSEYAINYIPLDSIF